MNNTLSILINNFKDAVNLYLSSILAGICISIGCIVNLMVGGGIPGAVLFTFGLIAVVHYKYKLYTGTAGFIHNFEDTYILLFYIFIGNIVGCCIASDLMTIAIPELVNKSNVIIQQRMSVNIWQAFIRAIFCGILMTTAVKFARENKWLPLIFAVPVFILSGFYHSIADAFYIATSNIESKCVTDNYLMTIIGNFVGCNIHRIVKYT